PEAAELVPGAGVDDDDGVGAAVLVAGPLEEADAPRRVEEGVARGVGTGDRHADVLAERFQRLGQGEHRAEPVAVGANVGSHQEAVVTADELDKRRPVNRHGGSFLAGRFVNSDYNTARAMGKRFCSVERLALSEPRTQRSGVSGATAYSAALRARL